MDMTFSDLLAKVLSIKFLPLFSLNFTHTLPMYVMEHQIKAVSFRIKLAAT